jgi:hypothetical protein
MKFSSWHVSVTPDLPQPTNASTTIETITQMRTATAFFYSKSQHLTARSHLAGGDAEESPADPGVGGLGDAHLHPHELTDRGRPPRRRRRLAAAPGAADTLGGGGGAEPERLLHLAGGGGGEGALERRRRGGRRRGRRRRGRLRDVGEGLAARGAGGCDEHLVGGLAQVRGGELHREVRERRGEPGGGRGDGGCRS